MIHETTLRSLAPAHLRNHRVARYEGGDMGIRMSDLTPDNAARVRELYAALSALLGELREALGIPAGDGTAPGGFSNGSPDVHTPVAEQVARAWEILLRTESSTAWRAAIRGARALELVRHRQSDEVITLQQQALHDIRGGALAALALTLEFVAISSEPTADVVRAFYLVRDHLKIMRNALEDLDAPARARDTASRDHGTNLLFEKWTGAVHRQKGDRSARVTVDSTYEGSVSRRCLEFSALDRVLYNLMNNAARFTADGEVVLYLREMDGSLRFVVANAITDEQRSLLTEAHQEQLGRLFLGGFTTGGEGVGLSVCGEFVANAYGLPEAVDAVAGSYVGARLVDREFVAWFHWPTTTA